MPINVNEKYQLVLPKFQPKTDEDHATNLRAIDIWSKNFIPAASFGGDLWVLEPSGPWTFLQPSTAAAGTISIELSPGLSPGSRSLIEIWDSGGSTPGIDTFITANSPGDWDSIFGNDFNLQTGRDINLGADRSPGNDVNIHAHRNVNIAADDTTSINGNKLGFYNTALPAVVQAAHPTTLANVITILTNLGLCA